MKRNGIIEILEVDIEQGPKRAHFIFYIGYSREFCDFQNKKNQ